MPYRLVQRIKPLVLRIGWDSAAIIAELKPAMLFIAGELDTLVPPAHMRQLFAAATASSHKDFYSVANGNHNDTWAKAGSAYYIRLAQFLAAMAQQKGSTASTTQCNNDEHDLGDSNTTPSIPTMGKNFRVT